MGWFVLAALFVWNLVTFLLMNADKRRAEAGGPRFSERTLLLCAFLLGAPGILLGAAVFRHKTKKGKFKALVAVALVLNIILFALAGYLSICAPANPEALAAMEGTPGVTVEQTGGEITFTPVQQIKGGFIYYPGGQVAPESFAWAARRIAEDG